MKIETISDVTLTFYGRSGAVKSRTKHATHASTHGLVFVQKMCNKKTAKRWLQHLSTGKCISASNGNGNDSVTSILCVLQQWHRPNHIAFCSASCHKLSLDCSHFIFAFTVVAVAVVIAVLLCFAWRFTSVTAACVVVVVAACTSMLLYFINVALLRDASILGFELQALMRVQRVYSMPCVPESCPQRYQPTLRARTFVIVAQRTPTSQLTHTQVLSPAHTCCHWSFSIVADRCVAHCHRGQVPIGRWLRRVADVTVGLIFHFSAWNVFLRITLVFHCCGWLCSRLQHVFVFVFVIAFAFAACRLDWCAS